MPVLERYVMRRIFRSGGASFCALLGMFWALESLDRVDVVTSKGQSIWTFQVISVLALTQIAQIVAPIAFLIGLVFTLSRMNADSELAVIMSAGARRRTIFRPVLVSAAVLAVAVALMAFLVTPSSISGMRDLLYRVRADIIREEVREGGFRRLDGDKLVIHIREKAADGSFRGVFINDARDPEEPLQYLAGRAALIEEEEQAFLILVDGTVVRSRPGTGAAEIVDFKTHAIDLSQFTRAGAGRSPSVAERTLAQLMNPKADDPEYQDHPERFLTELHHRLSLPLYPFAFAAITLAGLSRPRAGRQDHIAATAAVVLVSLCLIFFGFSVFGTANAGRIAWPVIYAGPVLAIVVGFTAIFAGLRLSTPGWIRAAMAAVMAVSTRRQDTAAAGPLKRGA